MVGLNGLLLCIIGKINLEHAPGVMLAGQKRSGSWDLDRLRHWQPTRGTSVAGCEFVIVFFLNVAVRCLTPDWL